MNKRTTKKCDSTDQELLGSLKEMIDIRKQASKKESEPELKYHTMLANLDRMFKKLPEALVEDLNMEFVTRTYHVIKEHEQLQSK
jgi:hypothetical protein